MPLEKIPAILLIGLAFNITFRSPTPPTPKNERRVDDGLIKVNWMAWIVTATQAAYYVHALIELYIIVAGGETSSKGVVVLLLPNGKHPDCIKLTPTAAFATALIVLGSSIRYWCFRELGRHFTWNVTLLKNHKLITSGPYSFVRHPSYTGLVFMIVGMAIWYSAHGSWFRESLVYQTKLSWLIIAPVTFSLLMPIVVMFRRMPAEDAILEGEFGKEWDEWAKRVRYRLVPGLL